MTEEEWLECVNAEQIVAALPDATIPRRLHLLCVACCERFAPLLSEARSRQAIDILGQYADGAATDEELSAAQEAAADVYNERCVAVGERYYLDPTAHAASAVWNATISAWEALERMITLSEVAQSVLVACVAAAPEPETEMAAQAALVRDIFGNPFRPITLDPSWLTSTVITLARTMYDTRDFSAMPILADALADAGCGDDQVLSHCRGNGPHVKGCFVVDLFTGKS